MRTTRQNYEAELNELLSKSAHYENLIELMDATPPSDPEEKKMVEKLAKAFHAALDILIWGVERSDETNRGGND